MFEIHLEIHISIRPIHISVRPIHISVSPIHISVRPIHISVRPVHISVRPVHISVRLIHISVRPVHISLYPMRPFLNWRFCVDKCLLRHACNIRVVPLFAISLCLTNAASVRKWYEGCVQQCPASVVCLRSCPKFLGLAVRLSAGQVVVLPSGRKSCGEAVPFIYIFVV
jgi:hypothetical protein